MVSHRDRVRHLGIFLLFRAQEEFDFFLDDEYEDDSFAVKPNQMGNRLNAPAGRLPTTEELDEDQLDNDNSEGDDGEHVVPNANANEVGSGRRESLTVSRPILPWSLHYRTRY